MTIGNQVLCQDCLRVKPYSDARHMNVERCVCGGDFCGCAACNDTILGLVIGVRSSEVLGVRGPIREWTPNEGKR